MGMEMLLKALLKMLNIDINDFNRYMTEGKTKLQDAANDIKDLRDKIDYIHAHIAANHLESLEDVKQIENEVK